MLNYLVILALLPIMRSELINYNNSKVYRVYPSNNTHLKTLSDLHNNPHFDFLSYVRKDAHPIDVIVDDVVQSYFTQILEKASIKYEITVRDVASALQEDGLAQQLKSNVTKDISFTEYPTYDEINNFLDEVVRDHPDIASLETIGHSYERRRLRVIKISKNLVSNKPIIFIDAGMHGAEWLAPPVALYAIQQLVNRRNSYLLDKVDWHILPMINPDGYIFSQETYKNRLWRKTRSPGLYCTGTDPNRNFNFYWGGDGSSGIECFPTYRGTSAFSESETTALSKYILKIQENLKLYLTLHTFGSLILHAWGNTLDLPDNYAELQALGEDVAKSIAKLRGTIYEVGSCANLLYLASGKSDDWTRSVAGVDLTYTIELPKGGMFGFNPPPTEIRPTVVKTWQGIKTFHEYIVKKYT